jgi:membrane protein implicated in regulation of membrane protease activity
VAARSGLGALVAGVVWEALVARLKWGVTLAVAVFLLAVIGSFDWLTPKFSEPEEVKTAEAAEGGGAVASTPFRPRLQGPGREWMARSAFRRLMGSSG